jgi:hypothetical protein
LECGPDDSRPRTTGADAAAVDQVRAVDDANGKPGKVVLVLAIHAGHFSRLSTDQCTLSLPATLGYSLDDCLGIIDFQLPGGIVVKEEQGLGAAGKNIIDAHGDQVDANGVMFVQQPGKQ